ncbi:MAG TPA: methyltransferase [Mycobacteriales bacterium]|nr:methyltransferase [Mycobacteriales bacterium]
MPVRTPSPSRRRTASSGGVPPALAVRLASAARRLLLRLADRCVPAPVVALDHVHGFVRTYLMATAAELGVADHLRARPLTAAELAPLVDAQPDVLHRVLRAAATFGMVRLDRGGRFHATRLTRALCSDHAWAIADWSRYLATPSLQSAWCDLPTTVRTGDDAFRRVHGTDCFSWFAAHPDEGQRFAHGLGGLTRGEAAAIIAGYPFPRSGRVCDVGGGAGVLLAEILKARPGLSGTLVESAHMLGEAKELLDENEVLDRTELVTGDFFEPLTVDADLYLLKWVLHDWDDDTCVRILANVAAAMPAGSRLLVIEGDQPVNRPHERFSLIDAQMLITAEGGRERSGEELSRLVARSGLTPGARRHTATGLVLVEGERSSRTA